MPDDLRCNSMLHAGCPEGDIWIRRLDSEQIAKLVLRIDQRADNLSGASGTRALESEPLTPERRALIEQAKTQADALFELTGKICDPG